MSEGADGFVVDFPTLGYLGADWIAEHCIVPDGFRKGRRFEMADWQLWCTVNHYRVREDAVWDPEEPRVSTNFFYRQSQIVAPQKTGKGPWAAAIIALEALGPTVFVGWAQGGELYECGDHGCDCGWVYEYDPGEPMGTPRPTPLIQLTATAKEQTANVYRPLKAMFRGTGLSFEAGSRTGEEFIRLPDDGRIDTVTSSAQSKLGNPVTFVLHDESGLYTDRNRMKDVADTQNRGLAGMDARGMETTNPWDPTQNSTAQNTFESPATDIFRFYREPPAAWKYTNAEDRKKIHRYVYQGSPWVNLVAIESLAVALMAKGETAQAERFFGNRRVRGAGKWLEDGLFDGAKAPREVPDGVPVCGGFDGSDTDDWSAIRLETMDGYQFTPTYGPDHRPCTWNPAEWGGKIPRLEVAAAWDELSRRYRLVRVYCDPPLWTTEIDDWALKYGEKVFLRWETYRPMQMHAALERVVVDLGTKTLTHDGDRQATTHFGNARRAARTNGRYILTKPSNTEKIDIAMSGTLAHEARCEAVADGWAGSKFKRAKGHASVY
jgi:hypothetical protein